MSIWTFFGITRPFEERAPEPPLIVEAPPLFDSQGWCTDPRVVRVPSRPGWYYRKLKTKSGLPAGITAHYTSTGDDTAMNMAERRRDHERSEFKNERGVMPGSWGFTVARSGLIIQQLSLRQGGFHAGSKTARKTPVGWANHTTVGIELEGDGDDFTPQQVESSCWLWRALVRHCGIKREHAMLQHGVIDPTRKRDPGPVWMTEHAPVVLDFAFGSDQ